MAAQTLFRKISNESVKVRTGKNWKQWLAILDKFNVKKNGHKLAAKHLYDRYKLGPWWSQAVAIRYEWERGLRTMKDQREVQPKHKLFLNPKKKNSNK